MPIPFVLAGLSSLFGAGAAAATTAAGFATGVAATAGTAATTAAGTAALGAGIAAATTVAGLATRASATAGTVAATAAGATALGAGTAAGISTTGLAAAAATLAVPTAAAISTTTKTIIIGGVIFVIGAAIYKTGEEKGKTIGLKEGYELASKEFCDKMKQQLDLFTKNINAIKNSEIRELLDNCAFILSSYEGNRTFDDLSAEEKKNFFEITNRACKLRLALQEKELA